MGGGANAIAFLESLKHGLASDGDVTVFFSGSLESEAGLFAKITSVSSACLYQPSV